MSAPDPLTVAIRAQVRYMRRALKDSGGLTPPPGVPVVYPAQARTAARSLALSLTVAIDAAQQGGAGSAQWHYSRGLLYAGLVLREAQRVERDPLGVLTLLTAWAADFRRETLGAATAASLDALDDDPQALRAALGSLSDARERGALMAAQAVLGAASWAASDASFTAEAAALMFTAGAQLLSADPTTPPPSAAEA